MRIETSELPIVGARQLAQLLQVSAQLSSTLDLKSLLHTVVDVAMDLTDTDAASILLMDEKSGELRFVATSNDDLLYNVTVPVNSLSGWVVQNSKPLFIDDAQHDDRFYNGIDALLGYETRDMLIVPLKADERTIGAVEVINKQIKGGYSQRDLALLKILASQACVAIENALLFESSDLIAEVMHELKTPMTAIIAASEVMLRRATLSDIDLEMLQVIRRQAARMSGMASDFLELSRIEARRLHMQRLETHFDSIIPEVVQLVQPQADEQDIKISFELPLSLPPIIGDLHRLEQVALNLINNAVKYNRPGGRVHIKLMVDGEELLLSITDTGPGIPPEAIPHLYDRFFRVPGKGGDSEGSGLGLTIAHKIVEEHGGRIWVESQLGEGSTFNCAFPIPADECRPSSE